MVARMQARATEVEHVSFEQSKLKLSSAAI